MSAPYPCPNCGGTIRDRCRAIGTSEPMAGEWIVGSCDGCNTTSLDLVPSRPPPPRTVAAPVVTWSGDLSDIRVVPSAWFVPALTGEEVGRGGMVRCVFHDDEHPSMHVQDDDAGWCCHACGARGGLPEFFCLLQGRSVPSDRREFKRLLYEITDALRRSP